MNRKIEKMEHFVEEAQKKPLDVLTTFVYQGGQWETLANELLKKYSNRSLSFEERQELARYTDVLEEFFNEFSYIRKKPKFVEDIPPSEELNFDLSELKKRTETKLDELLSGGGDWNKLKEVYMESKFLEEKGVNNIKWEDVAKVDNRIWFDGLKKLDTQKQKVNENIQYYMEKALDYLVNFPEKVIFEKNIDLNKEDPKMPKIYNGIKEEVVTAKILEERFPQYNLKTTLDDLENGDLYNLHWHANNRLGISLDEEGYYVIKPVEITLENVSEVMEDKIMLKETYDKIWKL
jgi:hypothetical protein